jgi:DNA-binding HxlR family transcriptional regulator
MIAIQAASALIDRSACVTVASRAVGRRFNELKREVDGISQRMLTLTVRGLERDGLLTRTVTPSIPPRVDYALTELGRSLLEPVNALGTWAVENRTTVDAARQAFDADATH